MVGLASVTPAVVRRRFRPSASDVRALLEAVSEVEPVSADALPPAALAGHAVAALTARAPWFQLERVALSVRGAARADVPTRVAGIVASAGASRACARLRVRQPAGLVLDVTAFGSLGRTVAARVDSRVLSPELTLFARALREDEARYRGRSTGPSSSSSRSPPPGSRPRSKTGWRDSCA